MTKIKVLITKTSKLLTCCDTGRFCVSVFWVWLAVLFWLPQSTLVLVSAQSLLKFAYSEGRGGGGMLGGGADDSCTCKGGLSLVSIFETEMQGTNLSLKLSLAEVKNI